MSQLIHVINLTIFQEFSTACRKPVDNPAALWALSTIGAGIGSRPVNQITLYLFTTASSRNIAVVFFFFTLSNT
jgi:hypothetical protein